MHIDLRSFSTKMLTFYCFLVLLMSAVDFSFAKPLLEKRGQRKFFEYHFNKTIECNKKFLTTGIPELEIPPLDPLKIDKLLNVLVDNLYIWIKAKLYNLHVDGLVSYKAISIALDPFAKLDITFHIDEIRARAPYNGALNLLGLLLLEGIGDIDAKFQDITVYASIQFQNVPPLIFYSDIVITLGNADIDITEIYGDERLSKFISKKISEATTILINQYKKEIGRSVSAIVKEKANFHIGDLGFLDFLAIITAYSCD